MEDVACGSILQERIHWAADTFSLIPGTQMSRKLTSLGASVTKHAIKHAPVSDKVKDGVGAGADMVKDQADADPNASAAERMALGTSKCGDNRGKDFLRKHA